MGWKGFLRGNTATTIKLGPFLDATDGNTPETALTISQADVRLSKNSGDIAQKNDATACTHDELGKYDCPLNATDLNTYGRLDVTVAEAGALYVDDFYWVLPEPIYDSFAPASAGAPLPIFGVIDWGTAQASAPGTFVHRNGLSLANDIINGAVEHVYAGTGAGQLRMAYDFTSASDTSNVSPDWTTTPSTDSQYVTFGSPPAPTNATSLPTVRVGAMDNDVITDAAVAADTVTSIATGVWNNGTRILTANTNLSILDAAGIRTALGMASADLDTQLDVIAAAVATAIADIGTVDNLVDTEIAAILAAVDTEVAAIKAKTDQLTFTVAGLLDANSRRINDVALAGDGDATPVGAA